MKTVDHSKRRRIQEIQELDYPHECECGKVIRHVRMYQAHHDCDEQ